MTVMPIILFAIFKTASRSQRQNVKNIAHFFIKPSFHRYFKARYYLGDITDVCATAWAAMHK